MSSNIKDIKVGDEIFLRKYKGYELATDYSKSYTINFIDPEIQDNNQEISRYVILNNGNSQLLYSYSLFFTQQEVTYYVEQKQYFSYFCNILCFYCC